MHAGGIMRTEIHSPMTHFLDNTDDIEPQQLRGFFVGWPSPPSLATHLKSLNQSQYVVLALDERTGNVVGFITAISDNVLSAYMPLLEVLPEYQNRGTGR